MTLFGVCKRNQLKTIKRSKRKVKELGDKASKASHIQMDKLILKRTLFISLSTTKELWY